jgi:hypothetical protein
MKAQIQGAGNGVFILPRKSNTKNTSIYKAVIANMTLPVASYRFMIAFASLRFPDTLTP